MAPPASLVLAPDLSRDRAIRIIADAFRAAGIETPLREARILVCTALDLTPAALVLSGHLLLGDDHKRLETFTNRRAVREPMARISGHREFFGLDMSLSEATLVPRPDTETLVEAVLDHARARGLDQRPITVADLGTGSGAILAALLAHLPLASGLASDIAPQALETARKNLEVHGFGNRVRFHLGSWLDGLDEGFDIIVSNPPYIPTGDIAGLAPEVARHDPLLALDGGADGLDAYRALARACPGKLSAQGFLALEIGFDQAKSVTALMQAAGLRREELRHDLAGHPRALIFSHMTSPDHHT